MASLFVLGKPIVQIVNVCTRQLAQTVKACIVKSIVHNAAAILRIILLVSAATMTLCLNPVITVLEIYSRIFPCIVKDVLAVIR